MTFQPWVFSILMARIWNRLGLSLMVGSLWMISSPGFAQEGEQGGRPGAGPKPVESKDQSSAVSSKPGKAPAVVKTTKQSEDGIKTYEFGAVEVEGRLRSPQILYFLRRVRAEFDTDDLGHRSFMLELKDTRRHAAFR